MKLRYLLAIEHEAHRKELCEIVQNTSRLSNFESSTHMSLYLPLQDISFVVTEPKELLREMYSEKHPTPNFGGMSDVILLLSDNLLFLHRFDDYCMEAGNCHHTSYLFDCFYYTKGTIGNEEQFSYPEYGDWWDTLPYELYMHFCHKYQKKATVFSTNRLMFRELNGEDTKQIISLCDTQEDRVCLELLGETNEEIKDNQQAYYNYAYSFYGSGIWGLYEKATMSLIGKAGYIWNTRTQERIPEIGYFIAKPFRCKGYATEAVNALIAYNEYYVGTPRIWARIDERNLASVKVATKCKMKPFPEEDKAINNTKTGEESIKWFYYDNQESV